jgi:deoxyribose-phosphate aldolase
VTPGKIPTAINISNLAQHLILSNLGVDASKRDIKLTCLEAIQYGIPRILVNAVNISMAREFCNNTLVKVCAALSYPVGAYPPEVKGLEIQDAIKNGADEIFMLMAVGSFLDGTYDIIQKEMETMLEYADDKPAHYMIETSALSQEQLSSLCKLVKKNGIESIVTSTNFKQGGFLPANEQQILTLVDLANGKFEIVVFDDIANEQSTVKLLDTGVDKICTRYSIDIVKNNSSIHNEIQAITGG